MVITGWRSAQTFCKIKTSCKTSTRSSTWQSGKKKNLHQRGLLLSKQESRLSISSLVHIMPTCSQTERGGGNLSLRPPHTCFPSPIPAARVSTKLSDYKNKGLAILPSVSWDCLGSLDPGISAVSCWTRGGGGGGTVGNNALFHNWGIRNTNEGAWSKKKKKLG